MFNTAEILVSAIIIIVIGADVASSCRHAVDVTECYDKVLNATLKHNQNTMKFSLFETKRNILPIENLWNICRMYFEANGCLHERLKSCKRQKLRKVDYLSLYIDTTVKRGVIRLCDKQEILIGHALHSKCIHDQLEDLDNCLDVTAKRLSDAMKKHPTSISDFLNGHYCGVIRDVINCGHNAVDDPCGTEAGNVMANIISNFLPYKAAKTCMPKPSSSIESRASSAGLHLKMMQMAVYVVVVRIVQ